MGAGPLARSSRHEDRTFHDPERLIGARSGQVESGSVMRAIRPPPVARQQVEAAAMAAGDAVDDGQPQAGADGVGARGFAGG